MLSDFLLSLPALTGTRRLMRVAFVSQNGRPKPDDDSVVLTHTMQAGATEQWVGIASSKQRHTIGAWALLIKGCTFLAAPSEHAIRALETGTRKQIVAEGIPSTAVPKTKRILTVEGRLSATEMAQQAADYWIQDEAALTTQAFRTKEARAMTSYRQRLLLEGIGKGFIMYNQKDAPTAAGASPKPPSPPRAQKHAPKRATAGSSDPASQHAKKQRSSPLKRTPVEDSADASSSQRVTRSSPSKKGTAGKPP